MSRKKRTSPNASPRRAEQEPSYPVAEEAAGRGIGMRLAGIVLRSLTYRELPDQAVDPQMVQSAANFNVDLAASANVSFAGPSLAQITLTMRIRPDPKARPLEMEVVMSAAFQKDDDVSIRDFLSFISNSSGLILFPYVRELVASVTMRTPFGQVVLNPMRLGPVLSAEAIENFAREVEKRPGADLEKSANV